jgi:OFA family oxalate/formate antiporter-like MFS transporter
MGSDVQLGSRGRWGQLIIGVLCMSMIANLQYGWTLFVNPISAKHGWGKPAIQVAFTLFVLCETWLVPIEGYLVDRFGPKIVVILASLLVGTAWVMNSRATTLPELYFAAVIGGIGAGAVYGTCVGNALKWFPDRRGLAAGLTSMGFGAGSALTIVPIASTIKTHGYEYAFLVFGIGQGVTIFLIGWLLKAPPAEFARLAPSARRAAPVVDRSPTAMAKTPVFWILYVMFVLMAAGGLMATAQLAPIANDFRVADVPVSILGLTLPALTFALSIDRVLNGITRPVCGWISDRIGRENTMFLAFALEGCGILLLGSLGADPVMFVLLSAVVFFAWGEIYSLFPATCADTFGSKFASANAGLLYTAKGTAALLVPLTSVVAASGGGWRTVFLAASVSNFIAAALALFVLKPLRSHMRATSLASLTPAVVNAAPMKKAQ